MCAKSRPSRFKPPVFSFWLWQLTQYLSSIARAAAEFAGAVVLTEFALLGWAEGSAARNNKDARGSVDLRNKSKIFFKASSVSPGKTDYRRIKGLCNCLTRKTMAGRAVLPHEIPYDTCLMLIVFINLSAARSREPEQIFCEKNSAGKPTPREDLSSVKQVVTGHHPRKLLHHAGSLEKRRSGSWRRPARIPRKAWYEARHLQNRRKGDCQRRPGNHRTERGLSTCRKDGERQKHAGCRRLGRWRSGQITSR